MISLTIMDEFIVLKVTATFKYVMFMGMIQQTWLTFQGYQKIYMIIIHMEHIFLDWMMMMEEEGYWWLSENDSYGRVLQRVFVLEYDLENEKWSKVKDLCRKNLWDIVRRRFG